MAPGIAEFFIKFLTRPGDLVVDPFAGSNTTGAAAEALGRKWLAVELEKEYIRGSKGRFQKADPKQSR
jgi:site-specific DNA-methyltransferase (cytosine-N4-specific)